MNHNNLNIRDLIIHAREEFLVKKNIKALNLLENIEIEKISNEEDLRFYKNSLGLIYLETKEYKKAAAAYREIGERYQAGFCELLQGNEEEAERLWLSAPESEPCEWGKCALKIIKNENDIYPSFLQIRNHLEIDIGYFIQANKFKYAESLMSKAEIFTSINLESYKYIGRVLLNYGFLNQAKKYLLKSLQIIPNESETLYYLGQYNYLIGAYKESGKVLEKCLEYNSSYTPARELLSKIDLNLNKFW